MKIRLSRLTAIIREAIGDRDSWTPSDRPMTRKDRDDGEWEDKFDAMRDDAAELRDDDYESKRDAMWDDEDGLDALEPIGDEDEYDAFTMNHRRNHFRGRRDKF